MEQVRCCSWVFVVVLPSRALSKSSVMSQRGFAGAEAQCACAGGLGVVGEVGLLEGQCWALYLLSPQEMSSCLAESSVQCVAVWEEHVFHLQRGCADSQVATQPAPLGNLPVTQALLQPLDMRGTLLRTC